MSSSPWFDLSRYPLACFLSSLLAGALLGGCGSSSPTPMTSVTPCAAGSSGSGDLNCMTCQPGTWCPPGTATPVDCAATGRWDHDADPSTECVAVTECTSSEYVAAAPTATSDRRCTPLTVCGPGQLVATAGSSTSDRTCAPEWFRQFGSDRSDGAVSVSPDGSGNLLVVGYVAAALPGETAVGGDDAFIRKYAGDGSLLWTRQFGSSAADSCNAVDTDGSGNVLVAGATEGALPGETSAGAADVFVRKYASDGTLLWSRQFGSDLYDVASSLSVDANGGVLVAGYVEGALPGETTQGETDAFVRKYASDGTLLWTRQFGTSAGDVANSVSVDGNGNVLLVGTTMGALPDQSSAGDWDAFVRKYTSDGTLLWTRQFGTTRIDNPRGVGADGEGNVLLAGYTSEGLASSSDFGDVVVRKYSSDGALLWSQQFGSDGLDVGRSVSVDRDGNLLVAGSTSGVLPGQSSAGGLDLFVLKYARDGTLLRTRQFGTNGGEEARSLRLDAQGNLLVAGFTSGAWPGQTSAGLGDAFVARLAAP